MTTTTPLRPPAPGPTSTGPPASQPSAPPEAHLQIEADSESWNGLCDRGGLGERPLAKLHFPVGGRRFRPTVEELIEFLVVEVRVDARRGWMTKVEEGRQRFEERQLRAAIRRRPEAGGRRPEWAMDQLSKLGHL